MIIKVIIVDDHPMVREGLTSLLENFPDIAVIAEASNGMTAIACAAGLLPDVMVVDISMPGMSGIEVIRRITKDYPAIEIIALSMHSDKRLVIEALDAGARGYFFKECSLDDLASAIRTVAGKGVVSGPKMPGIIISNRPQVPVSSLHLSAREIQVLRSLATGENARETAILLKVSVKTIESDRHNIMGKLNLYSIPELIRYAIREGLSPAELT